MIGISTNLDVQKDSTKRESERVDQVKKIIIIILKKNSTVGLPVIKKIYKKNRQTSRYLNSIE